MSVINKIGLTLTLVIGIGLITIFIWAGTTDTQKQKNEPEFKIFSVCLEGHEFAVAMKHDSISITPIFEKAGMQGAKNNWDQIYTVPMECEK